MPAAAKFSPRFFPVRTLIGLRRSERRLLWRTAPVVVAIRAALWLLPLRRVRQLMRAGERLPLSIPADLPLSRLVWSVQAVSKRVPMASCLTQALALQFLLWRAGKSPEVHIGVAKDSEAGLRSHAWVECEGQILLSTPSEIESYSRVLALPQRGEG